MGELASYDPGDSFGPPGSLDGLRSAKTTTRAAARCERPGPQFPHRSLVSFMSRLMSLGSEPLRDELAGPARPPGGRVRVVAELLCHRPSQPRLPNCCTARLIAMAAMSAVGTSDGCSPEQNRAWQRASSMVVWVTAICVAVGISHHPVSLSRLWAAGPGHGRDRFSRLRAAGQMIMAGRARRDRRTRCRRSCSAARSSASASMNNSLNIGCMMFLLRPGKGAGAAAVILEPDCLRERQVCVCGQPRIGDDHRADTLEGSHPLGPGTPERSSKAARTSSHGLSRSA
jgi:hypothetical protein